MLPIQVENKVVAVDLSAWLMQAQMQPALLENYDSPYARAVKVVFDRVSCHHRPAATATAAATLCLERDHAASTCNVLLHAALHCNAVVVAG